MFSSLAESVVAFSQTILNRLLQKRNREELCILAHAHFPPVARVFTPQKP